MTAVKTLQQLPQLFRYADVEKFTGNANVFLTRALQNGLVERIARRDCRRKAAICSLWAASVSVIDRQPSFLENQPAGVELVHQVDVVGGDDHRRAEAVQLDEQAHQTPRRRVQRPAPHVHEHASTGDRRYTGRAL